MLRGGFLLLPAAAALKIDQKQDPALPNQCKTSSSELQEAFDTQVLPLLNTFTEAFQYGLAFAFHGKDNGGKEFTWSYTGGYADVQSKTKLSKSDLIPVGR